MMRNLVVLAGTLLAPFVMATADTPAAARATYRLDYFHTGGLGTEIFAVDRLRLEPLPWPGHPARASDDGQSGAYRYEVRDADGALLQARGFASVFGEWVTTEEAQKGHRTFHESVRFPGPGRPGPVHVRIFKRDAHQAFQPVWETTIDTTNMFVDRIAAPSQALLPVERHGDPVDKVDLLLIGDGYTAAECAGKFRDDTSRMTAALFSQEPFRRRRNDFNVWGLCPPAAESGISRPSTGVQRATPVGATYDAFGSERYVLTFDNRALREVASQAPYEAIVILANGNTYGGGGIFNLYSTVAVDSSWSDYLFVHEFGHHFAALADEYYTSPVAYQSGEARPEPWEPNVTALRDPAKLKWKDRVTPNTPLPTPWPKAELEKFQREYQKERAALRAANRPESEMNALFKREREFTNTLFAKAVHGRAVGAFEGANYQASGYYRPQMQCIMFDRSEEFCRICADAIEEIIDLYSR